MYKECGKSGLARISGVRWGEVQVGVRLYGLVLTLDGLLQIISCLEQFLSFFLRALIFFIQKIFFSYILWCRGGNIVSEVGLDILFRLFQIPGPVLASAAHIPNSRPNWSFCFPSPRNWNTNMLLCPPKYMKTFLSACVGTWKHTWYSVCLCVGWRIFCWHGSLLPPYGFQGSNSGYQDRQQSMELCGMCLYLLSYLVSQP